MTLVATPAWALLLLTAIAQVSPTVASILRTNHDSFLRTNRKSDAGKFLPLSYAADRHTVAIVTQAATCPPKTGQTTRIIADNALYKSHCAKGGLMDMFNAGEKGVIGDVDLSGEGSVFLKGADGTDAWAPIRALQGLENCIVKGGTAAPVATTMTPPSTPPPAANKQATTTPPPAANNQATDATKCNIGDVGGGWDLVRRTTSNTFPDTDQLVGSSVYGTPHDNPLGQSFAKRFDTIGFKDFLFTTGDCSRWVIMAKEQVLAWYTNQPREILASHTSSSPYSAKMYRRAGSKEDPWITFSDHINDYSNPPNAHCNALYQEANYDPICNTGDLGTLYQGLNVFIRKALPTTITPVDDDPYPTSFLLSGCRRMAEEIEDKFIDPSGMTHSKCFARCRKHKGARQFAITNGGLCICSTTSLGEPLSSDYCDTRCAGDNTEFCGGLTAASVFTMIDCSFTVDEEKEELDATKTKMMKSYAQFEEKSCGQDKDNVVELDGSSSLAGTVDQCKLACWQAKGAQQCHGFTYDSTLSRCTFHIDVFGGSLVDKAGMTCFWKKI